MIQFPPPDAYITLAKAIKHDLSRNVTPVVEAFVGTGKSTQLAFYLAREMSCSVTVVLPTIALAKSVLSDVVKSVNLLNNQFGLSLSVGYKIAGEKCEGNIMVVTPLYANPQTELTIYDEFQELYLSALMKLSSIAAWDRVVLSSATPRIPLLGCVA